MYDQWRQMIFTSEKGHNTITYWFNAKIIQRKNSFRQNTLVKSTYFLSSALFSRRMVLFKVTSLWLRQLNVHLRWFETWLKLHVIVKWQQFDYVYDASLLFLKKKNNCLIKELDFSDGKNHKNYNSLNICCKVNFNGRTIIFSPRI